MTPRAVTAALVACLLAVRPASAQQARAVVPFEGSHAFRHILNLHRLEPLKSVAALRAAPAGETLLMVFGDTRGLKDIGPAWLARFRDGGGAVLIATDQADRGRLNVFGVEVNGHGVEVHAGVQRTVPGLAYQGQPACPLIKHFSKPSHPVFRGLERGIATNRPSYVTGLPGNELALLARFPLGCVDETDPQFAWLPVAFGTPEADAVQEGRRVLVLSAPSVFMNGMMGRTDNDNFAFAWNSVRWLTNGGRRKYALFLEDGRPVTTFDVPLLQPPLPPLKIVNHVLRGLEEENFFNRLILDNVPRERILRGLFLSVSGMLLLYGLVRLVRVHHRAEVAAPLVAAGAARQTEQPPTVVRRRHAAVQEGHCGEAARDLARLCFEGPGAAGERPEAPPQVVHGGRRLRRDVERLWRLAYGEAPPPVTAGEFPGVLAALARVRTALDDGSLRFEQNGQPPAT